MPQASNVDYSDMQGLLRFGFGKLTEACFLLLHITDTTKASLWLEAAPVTTAEDQSPPPVRALQLAFTQQGLSRLGVPSPVLDGFSSEFLSGMTGEENRSRRLGDVGENVPASWLWGYQDKLPDIIALVYARADLFLAWRELLESQLLEAGCTIMQRLTTDDMGNIEPFGFADGVSSPVVDWTRQRDPSGDKLNYENMTMLGEFALGYPNEYGLYTDRPLIDDSHADLPDAEDQPGAKDLGRNGSYLVFRHIEQDVHGFWNFLSEQTGHRPDNTTQLAERLVGRRITGESLIDTTASPPIIGVGPGGDDLRLNQFTFTSDGNGLACPLGAHIRRANPRNADLPAGTHSSLAGRLFRILALDRVLNKESDARGDRVASARFHRLQRRGREYGPKLTHEQRLADRQPDEPSSGLHFICLNANIGRQFEFVQSAWLHSSNFDGLRDENDPLTGNRETVSGCPAANFTIPAAKGVRQRIKDIPRFTTTRGGAYFFLPGIRALRYLVRCGRR